MRYDGREDDQQQLSRYRYLQLLLESLVDVLLTTHAHIYRFISNAEVSDLGDFN